MKKKTHKHMFSYAGGEAKCKCGKFLQPDGRITDTATGRIYRKKKTTKNGKRKS